MIEPLLIGGWEQQAAESFEVRNPWDGAEVARVSSASPAHVEDALAVAAAAAPRLATVSGHDRGRWLREAARRLASASETFARTITQEEGKTIREARFEVSRAVITLERSAEEATRLTGEMVPLDGAPGGAGRLGFTVRVPCGVAVGITPFNFPLNLVCHKVGPALAAGNAVILKPASATPLTALALTRLLWESGVPGDALSCLTGPGGAIGTVLASDRRVRKISFTGSHEVGERICRTAGVKRVTMELGSNSPLVVMEDADLDLVTQAAAVTGYGNAGQVCISTQRLLVDRRIHDDLLRRLRARVDAIVTGDPLLETTAMGPMVRRDEATRVREWLDEAVSRGGRLVTGGEVEGSTVRPALVDEPPDDCRLVREELFGPAIAVRSFSDLGAAIAEVNDSRFGLAAGLFTRDIDRALRFLQEVRAGNIHINWGPGWRADLMPYGGLGDSGFGKEGPRYAIREMSEEKMIVIHPRS